MPGHQGERESKTQEGHTTPDRRRPRRGPRAAGGPSASHSGTGGPGPAHRHGCSCALVRCRECPKQGGGASTNDAHGLKCVSEFESVRVTVGVGMGVDLWDFEDFFPCPFVSCAWVGDWDPPDASRPRSFLFTPLWKLLKQHGIGLLGLLSGT